MALPLVYRNMAKSQAIACINALDDTSTIYDRVRNVLVLLTGTEIDQRLIRKAGKYVTSTGDKLKLVSITTSNKFTERQQAYTQIAHLPTYTVYQAEESCRQHALKHG